MYYMPVYRMYSMPAYRMYYMMSPMIAIVVLPKAEEPRKTMHS